MGRTHVDCFSDIKRGFVYLQHIDKKLNVMNDLELYTKLAELPDEFKKEVPHFVDFLKTKMTDKEANKK